ncbi:MAG: aro1 [Alphaproteobacteria bacterium]|nr:aro1 [Alphaproteobacteria bacterium]
MTLVNVDLGERSHPVRIESGGLDWAGQMLAPFARDGRIVVVTDRNVLAAQGDRLTAGLNGAGILPDGIVIAPGEETKDWSHLARLVDDLVARGVGRGDHVVAFGGGVIGDLVGFAAAILERGVGLIHVPTSLVAMVAGSVGGRTAINTPSGRNIVGAVHQPSFVLIDPDCLDSLPVRELRAGYAEVVKHGLGGDPDFFAWCEANGSILLAGDQTARELAIAECVRMKAAAVAEDERDETGGRALLDLGHGFAQAIEAESNYRLLRGEAVAIGLCLAFRLSSERGLCPAGDAERVEAHLRAVALPTSLNEAGLAADGERLAERIRHDRKATEDKVRLTLARGIGEAVVADAVPLNDIAAFLDRQRQPLDA